MKHLFQNDEGETVAADTLEQASQYHDYELGGKSEPDNGWEQIPDGAVISITYVDETGKTETKTAVEWAAEHDEPTVVSSTYS